CRGATSPRAAALAVALAGRGVVPTPVQPRGGPFLLAPPLRASPRRVVFASRGVVSPSRRVGFPCRRVVLPSRVAEGIPLPVASPVPPAAWPPPVRAVDRPVEVVIGPDTRTAPNRRADRSPDSIPELGGGPARWPGPKHTSCPCDD